MLYFQPVKRLLPILVLLGIAAGSLVVADVELLLHDGQVIKGRWRRDSGDEPLEFVRRGRPIALNPGNTWIELAEAVPTSDPSDPDVAMEITGG